MKINNLLIRKTLFRQSKYSVNGNNQNTSDNIENVKLDEQKCDGKEKEGNCLFGCDDTGVSKYTKEENTETKPANLEDMMKTFEETEKICEAIEKR